MFFLLLILAYCFFRKKKVTPRLLMWILLLNAAGIGIASVIVVLNSREFDDQFIVYVLMMTVAMSTRARDSRDFRKLMPISTGCCQTTPISIPRSPGVIQAVLHWEMDIP
jgi:hypothetical protein